MPALLMWWPAAFFGITHCDTGPFFVCTTSQPMSSTFVSILRSGITSRTGATGAAVAVGSGRVAVGRTVDAVAVAAGAGLAGRPVAVAEGRGVFVAAGRIGRTVAVRAAFAARAEAAELCWAGVADSSAATLAARVAAAAAPCSSSPRTCAACTSPQARYPATISMSSRPTPIRIVPILRVPFRPMRSSMRRPGPRRRCQLSTSIIPQRPGCPKRYDSPRARIAGPRDIAGEGRAI